MKMTVNDFISKLNLALENKSYYARGAFGAPLTQAMKDRYNVPIPVDPSRFLFDCVGLGKACLGGWNADSNAIYGGTWAHTYNGALVYGEMNVPDLNETDFFNRCSDISTDFSTIVPGEAVWMTGHIGFYVGDGFAIEATPIWANGVQKTACNVSKPGYNRRTWLKHGKLPWVEYAEQPAPSYGYKYNGIDISKYQGNIDFQTLKGNVDFVISRTWIGKPMSPDSTGDYDSKAFDNWRGAIAAGIPIHPYMLTYARDDESVREEVRSIKWWFANQPINTPRKIVWIDFENTGGINWADYSAADILHRFQLYYELLKQSNIEMGIYSSRGPYWSTKLTDPWYDAHVLKWVAVYYSNPGADLANDPNWNRSYAIWQSSSDGTVPGISARVDLDHSNVDLWGIEEHIEPSPTPDPEPDPDPSTPPSTEEVEELHAQLYSFREKKEVINKLESDIETLWYGQIVPYNVVSSLSFAFSLSVIYPANYCRFKINGLQYFAYVEVRTLANGLYLYECTIDAGTTAYYQGMFTGQTGTFIYSPNGQILWRDRRVQKTPDKQLNIEYFQDDSSLEDALICTVSSDAIRFNTGFQMNQNPALDVGIFHQDSCYSFFRAIADLDATDARIFLPSVVSTYWIRKFPFSGVWDRIRQEGLFPNNRAFSIFGVPSSDFGSASSEVKAYKSKELLPMQTGTTMNQFSYINSNLKTSNLYYVPSSYPKILLNSATFNLEYNLYVEGCGNIKFRICDIFDASIYQQNVFIGVKYKKYFDLAGQNLIARLVLTWERNGSVLVEREFDEYQIISKITEQFPVLCNTNVVNYSRIFGTAASAAGQAIAFAASGNMIGAAFVAGSAALGIANDISDMKKNAPPTQSRGTIGGSIERPTDQKSYLWYEYDEEIDRIEFASIFGKPDGSTKLISTEFQTAGYHQAGDVNVRANGYNESIVEGAKQALQGGVYVV